MFGIGSGIQTVQHVTALTFNAFVAAAIVVVVVVATVVVMILRVLLMHGLDSSFFNI